MNIIVQPKSSFILVWKFNLYFFFIILLLLYNSFRSFLFCQIRIIFFLLDFISWFWNRWPFGMTWNWPRYVTFWAALSAFFQIGGNVRELFKTSACMRLFMSNVLRINIYFCREILTKVTGIFIAWKCVILTKNRTCSKMTPKKFSPFGKQSANLFVELKSLTTRLWNSCLKGMAVVLPLFFRFSVIRPENDLKIFHGLLKS